MHSYLSKIGRLLAAPLLFVAITVSALPWAGASPEPVGAVTNQFQMHLAIAEVCTAAGYASVKCEVSQHQDFTVDLQIPKIPSPGICQWYSQIDFVGVTYAPTANKLDEFTLPMLSPIRSVSSTTVVHSDTVSELLSDSVANCFGSTRTGDYLSLSFTCTESGAITLPWLGSAVLPYVGGTVNPPKVQLDITCVPPPVGGVAFEPERDALPAIEEVGASSMSGARAGLLALSASAIATAGAVWWLRRRPSA